MFIQSLECKAANNNAGFVVANKKLYEHISHYVKYWRPVLLKRTKKETDYLFIQSNGLPFYEEGGKRSSPLLRITKKLWNFWRQRCSLVPLDFTYNDLRKTAETHYQQIASLKAQYSLDFHKGAGHQ